MTKVLIIDDSIFTLHHYAELIARLGCEVVTAESGADGLDMFAEQRPNIVLCDLMMPEMDGFEVLEKLMPLKIPTAFLFMTADIQNNTRKKALELGAQDVIAKPVTELSLREVLNRYGT